MCSFAKSSVTTLYTKPKYHPYFSDKAAHNLAPQGGPISTTKQSCIPNPKAYPAPKNMRKRKLAHIYLSLNPRKDLELYLGEGPSVLVMN